MKLTANELAVLRGAADANEDNGRDFGFIDEIVVDGKSRHAIAGTCASLQAKGLVFCYDNEGYPGIDLTEAGWAIIDDKGGATMK
jgi:hypothetical protein